MQAVAIGGAVVSALGTAYSAIQAQQAGIAEKRAADYRAQQERQAAIAAQATASQKAADQALRTEYTLSAARAAAAGSGAGATDPTVENVEGQLKARGDYNVASELYTGNERAAGLTTQAGLDVYQGSQAAAAGTSKMYGGLLSGLGQAMNTGSSLYEKYGSPPDPNAPTMSGFKFPW